MSKPKKSATTQTRDGAFVLRAVLQAAEPRPVETDTQSEKNKYAGRFAENMAKELASDLASHFPGIEASAERKAGSNKGAKQLDVNYSTSAIGLGLGVSLKSVHLRDARSKRFTHNMKRNEEELRIEALGYHKRQPYAIMVGILFLPFESCEDGKEVSSFGSWVRYLRPFTGRSKPTDDFDFFEKIYVALYETSGSDVRFFDVDSNPPKKGRPRESLSYADLIAALHGLFLERNRAAFKWADGPEDPLDVEPTPGEPEGDED